MTKRKRRLGDRFDGRRIRSLPPMNYVSPFIMKTRQDSSNLFRSRVDLEEIDGYMRSKRKEGLVNFSFMHVMIAAYIRVVSQRPAINRFISGQRIYQHEDIIVSLAVKKEMKLNAQETVIKVTYAPEDTVFDVYTKLNETVTEAKKIGDSTSLDTVARALVKLPALLLRGFIGLVRGLDYIGLMPKVLYTASPFHASMFISNLGSLGIPPIYHHLYDFGNVPFFITFGSKYRENAINDDGEVVVKRYIDYTVVADERITDGHYMASAFKYLEYVLRHPEMLDTPPETVEEDVD